MVVVVVVVVGAAAAAAVFVTSHLLLGEIVRPPYLCMFFTTVCAHRP